MSTTPCLHCGAAKHWSLQDQLDLLGKRGVLRQLAARRRYAAHQARARREAAASNARYQSQLKENR